MKICISSSGDKLDSPLDLRFGRCSYFLIVDSESKEVTAVENTGVRASRGAGISAAQIVADLGCGVVITGNVGPNAFSALSAAGLRIFTGAIGKSCERSLKDYNDGKLEEVAAPLCGSPAIRPPSTAPVGQGRGRRGR